MLLANGLIYHLRLHGKAQLCDCAVLMPSDLLSASPPNTTWRFSVFLMGTLIGANSLFGSNHWSDSCIRKNNNAVLFPCISRFVQTFRRNGRESEYLAKWSHTVCIRDITHMHHWSVEQHWQGPLSPQSFLSCWWRSGKYWFCLKVLKWLLGCPCLELIKQLQAQNQLGIGVRASTQDRKDSPLGVSTQDRKIHPWACSVTWKYNALMIHSLPGWWVMHLNNDHL